MNTLPGPAPLELRPTGAIQMYLLLFLLLLLSLLLLLLLLFFLLLLLFGEVTCKEYSGTLI